MDVVALRESLAKKTKHSPKLDEDDAAEKLLEEIQEAEKIGKEDAEEEKKRPRGERKEGRRKKALKRRNQTIVERPLLSSPSPSPTSSPPTIRREDHKRTHGYCRGFLPLVLRYGDPVVLNSPSCQLNETDDLSEHVSERTKKKIIATGNYFSQYYTQLFDYIFSRRQRMELINSHCKSQHMSPEEEHHYRSSKAIKESIYLRLRRTRLKVQDFQVLSLIGRGGYGEVFLCKNKNTGDVVALKRMEKSLFINKNEVPRVKREKEVMTKIRNEWMVKLYSSFQDEKYLYLCMEYLPGGDLKNLLGVIGRLSEDHTRLYVAEMVLAVGTLHKLGYIHRDLKPGNFLIDKNGHLKLIDFGLSKEGVRTNLIKSQMNIRNSMRFSSIRDSSPHPNSINWAHSLVGSPEYMAPEIIVEEGYDESVDWWSVGILMFEMLYGYTPFFSETVDEIFVNIANWENILCFPDLTAFGEDPTDPNFIDLMQRLITDPKNRIQGGEILKHPCFVDIDLPNIRDIVPPFVPKLQSEIDTTYFEEAVSIEDTPDITDILERELTQQGRISSTGNKPTRQNNPLLRSTHFATSDDMLFAGFTYSDPMGDFINNTPSIGLLPSPPKHRSRSNLTESLLLSASAKQKRRSVFLLNSSYTKLPTGPLFSSVPSKPLSNSADDATKYDDNDDFFQDLRFDGPSPSENNNDDENTIIIHRDINNKNDNSNNNKVPNGPSLKEDSDFNHNSQNNGNMNNNINIEHNNNENESFNNGDSDHLQLTSSVLVHDSGHVEDETVSEGAPHLTLTTPSQSEYDFADFDNALLDEFITKKKKTNDLQAKTEL